MHWLIDNSYQVKIIFISGYVEIIFFNFMKTLLPDAFILCCFCPKTESSDFGSWLRPFAAGQWKP